MHLFALFRVSPVSLAIEVDFVLYQHLDSEARVHALFLLNLQFQLSLIASYLHAFGSFSDPLLSVVEAHRHHALKVTSYLLLSSNTSYHLTSLLKR